MVVQSSESQVGSTAGARRPPGSSVFLMCVSFVPTLSLHPVREAPAAPAILAVLQMSVNLWCLQDEMIQTGILRIKEVKPSQIAELGSGCPRYQICRLLNLSSLLSLPDSEEQV